MAGQYVAYTFYRVDPAWRQLPVEERAAGKEAFADVVEDWTARMDSLRVYTVTGVRPDCDFFLWKITQRYEDLGELGAALNGMRIGHEFPTIYNHTTYSFGIDDQEFMTAFECDEPSDFMHLMLTLRESEASRYTERDTPIFVGQQVDIRTALDALDGSSARVEL